MDNNQLIGQDNALPWHLPEDLAFFKKITLNKPIIMGRKTFDSIGKPLPQRKNIIVTRNPDLKIKGCVVLDSLESVLDHCKDEEEIMLIGGASLYKQWLPFANQMYITLIGGSFEGDAWFPNFNVSEWNKEWSESHQSVKNPNLNYQFIKYRKI